MLTAKEENELRLLGVLAATSEPIGSISLSLILEEQSSGISPATIGRMLSELDHKGYTQKHGYKGRLLTREGEARLAALTSRRTIAEYSDRFIEAIDGEDKDNLIDILIARRGIERETARLAALNASEEDVEAIRDAFLNRFDEEGLLSPEYDLAFHRAIAKASGNKVLFAAYDFIWQNGRFSPVMEFIRVSVGGVVAKDHGRIMDAIVAHDAQRAEKNMVRHIESLIRDVHTYWHIAAEKQSEEE